MTASYMDVYYCDDIRREEGNKLSFMGVYGSELIVPSFPCQLPKLCIAIRLVLGPSERPEDLRIVVYKGESELATMRPDPESISTAGEPGCEGAQPSESEARFQDEESELRTTIQVHAIFSPFVVEEETVMRVRAHGLGEPVRGQRLDFVRVASPPESPSE